jgi:hypothetical protein
MVGQIVSRKLVTQPLTNHEEFIMTTTNATTTKTVEKKKAGWKMDGTVLTVTFPDGTKDSFDVAMVKDDGIRSALLGYGLKQKLSDSTARNKDERLTTEERLAEMKETFNLLVAGTWAEKGTGRKKDFTWAETRVWKKEELSALSKVKDLPGMSDAKKAWDAIPADIRKKFGYDD